MLMMVLIFESSLGSGGLPVNAQYGMEKYQVQNPDTGTNFVIIKKHRHTIPSVFD